MTKTAKATKGEKTLAALDGPMNYSGRISITWELRNEDRNLSEAASQWLREQILKCNLGVSEAWVLAQAAERIDAGESARITFNRGGNPKLAGIVDRLVEKGLMAMTFSQGLAHAHWQGQC